MDKTTGSIHEGIISINAKGTGFVAIGEESNNPKRDREEDILIPEEFTGVALHGDTVRIKIRKETLYDRKTGEVLEVIARKQEQFVGTVVSLDGRTVFVADNRRINMPFAITNEQEAKIDMKVMAKLKPWNDPKFYPEVTIVKEIGMKGDNNAEMNAIVLERGFEPSFPVEVEAEADAIKAQSSDDIEKELKHRRDFRNILTFTIDPIDAKDFDDAISFQQLEHGLFEVGVHIADVSHYVRPGTELDKEAAKRGTSVYLVDRTIPMLPEVLSNDLCSLRPHEEKLAFSAVFKVDINGAVHESWFGRTVIKSAHRFTYETAQESIVGNNDTYRNELQTLNTIAKNLSAERTRKGAISFEQDEVKFELDEFGKPVRVYRKVRFDAHKLVEEFMLLANREVATYINKVHKKDGNHVPLFLYRIHDVPDYEKIAELSIFIKALGHELNLNDGHVTGKDLNALFNKIEGKAEEGIIKTAAVRSMAKAIYSTKNIGHFGLAFDYYSHFTSPIRRYPDTMVHRLLAKYLAHTPISKDEFHYYENMASRTTEAEIRASEAERESIKMKQVEFMLNRVGTPLQGVISGVTEWGLYVEEEETKSEGMVRLRDLGDDFYMLDAKNYCIVGEKTKKRYTLGDSVKFIITAADPERKSLDCKLI